MTEPDFVQVGGGGEGLPSWGKVAEHTYCGRDLSLVLKVNAASPLEA